ncbi:MAG: FAD-dependent oxidoreductase [Candidatus Diapherotrites archaeon]|nr:FAD-dependent oxidoreductase [Candidatus Diapherotrites archaeon]
MIDKSEELEILLEPRQKIERKSKRDLIYDVAVIGYGPAGLCAAMYASRLGLNVLIFKEIPGGKISLTDRIENYPGIISINGKKLFELLENHMLDYGVSICEEKVEDIKKEKYFKVFTEKETYNSKTIILATGSEPKELNIKGEKEFLNKGVSYCALCDAAFFKNKKVVVIGGGDSAIKEAVLLSKYAKKTYVINNLPKIHPEAKNLSEFEKILKKGKAEIINSNEVVEIKGKRSVEKIVLKKKYRGKNELRVDGVFIYVGQNPRSELAKKIGIKLNEEGEILINEKCETNIEGVFAAGDVTNNEFKQAITAAAQGATAAYHAFKYIQEEKNSKKT